MSPLLFNFVVDVLLENAYQSTEAGLIRGLGSDIYPRGVICLQYADDTNLFSKQNPDLATNHKWVLICFEQVWDENQLQ